jgi:hypothetical protein
LSFNLLAYINQPKAVLNSALAYNQPKTVVISLLAYINQPKAVVSSAQAYNQPKAVVFPFWLY